AQQFAFQYRNRVNKLILCATSSGMTIDPRRPASLSKMVDTRRYTDPEFMRENFAKRLESGEPIFLHETFYALMQGYDAVAMNTDVQVGGTDQLFNIIIAGRKLQEALEARGITPLSAEHEYLCVAPTQLPEDQATEVLTLIDKLEQDEDVQTVFHTLA
ncbi:MAG: hypothetical protein HC868_10175, partial [Sphingomonadales bacterium]|nr:hypothetical protein [Sphingomonadales bacterium]